MEDDGLDDLYYGNTAVSRLMNGIIDVAGAEGYITNVSVEEVPDSKYVQVSFYWKPPKSKGGIDK